MVPLEAPRCPPEGPDGRAGAPGGLDAGIRTLPCYRTAEVSSFDRGRRWRGADPLSRFLDAAFPLPARPSGGGRDHEFRCARCGRFLRCVIPQLAAFDLPTTTVLKSDPKTGQALRWNPVFAEVMGPLGLSAEPCWSLRGNRKDQVENLVRRVKNSFFKVRRRHGPGSILIRSPSDWRSPSRIAHSPKDGCRVERRTSMSRCPAPSSQGSSTGKAPLWLS